MVLLVVGAAGVVVVVVDGRARGVKLAADVPELEEKGLQPASAIRAISSIDTLIDVYKRFLLTPGKT
ncbi:MAG: hypothetical protein NVS3B14_13010 [Ktedonobacteraceae bacterium]